MKNHERMGNKKTCSCGYWNKDQEECLYTGYGCAKDSPQMTKEEIQDKVLELFVILNILKPSQNDVDNAATFVRSLISVG